MIENLNETNEFMIDPENRLLLLKVHLISNERYFEYKEWLNEHGCRQHSAALWEIPDNGVLSFFLLKYAKACVSSYEKS